jgi:hypothetical protein
MPTSAQEGERVALTREAARQMPNELGRKVWQLLAKIARFRIKPHRIVQIFSAALCVSLLLKGQF